MAIRKQSGYRQERDMDALIWWLGRSCMPLLDIDSGRWVPVRRPPFCGDEPADDAGM